MSKLKTFETINIPQSILSKTKIKLHNKSDSPICLIKNKIYHFFKECGINFKTFDNLNEIVTVENNFDLLLIPKNHVSRSKSDTYYLDEKNVLRTHTSAHQNELLAEGEKHFLVTGDVYRKDEIDKFHYPVFHQMEGLHLVEDNIDPDQDLKRILSELVKFLFPNSEYRFNSDYFPFTNPSYEVEVKLGEKWVEILGCGVVEEKILQQNGLKEKAWAFGLGLERLAMILYNIPDIRLFWTDNINFTSQFSNKNYLDTIIFQQYPSIQSITKDISFWLNDNELIINENNTNNVIWLKLNDFFDIVRDCLESNVENIVLIDFFHNKKSNKYSQCWRITLSPSLNITDPGEFNKICNKSMVKLKNDLIAKLKLEIRG